MIGPQHRDKAERLWLDRVKVIRTAVRLRYARAADEELRVLLPLEYKEFMDAVNRGLLLPPPSADAYLNQKALPAAARDENETSNASA